MVCRLMLQAMNPACRKCLGTLGALSARVDGLPVERKANANLQLAIPACRVVIRSQQRIEIDSTQSGLSIP